MTAGALDVQPHGPDVVELPTGEHWLCGCDRSADGVQCLAPCPQPARARRLELRRSRYIWLCRCGRSHDLPYCDGSHMNPP